MFGFNNRASVNTSLTLLLLSTTSYCVHGQTPSPSSSPTAPLVLPNDFIDQAVTNYCTTREPLYMFQIELLSDPGLDICIRAAKYKGRLDSGLATECNTAGGEIDTGGAEAAATTGGSHISDPEETSFRKEYKREGKGSNRRRILQGKGKGSFDDEEDIDEELFYGYGGKKGGGGSDCGCAPFFAIIPDEMCTDLGTELSCQATLYDVCDFLFQGTAADILGYCQETTTFQMTPDFATVNGVYTIQTPAHAITLSYFMADNPITRTDPELAWIDGIINGGWKVQDGFTMTLSDSYQPGIGNISGPLRIQLIYVCPGMIDDCGLDDLFPSTGKKAGGKKAGSSGKKSGSLVPSATVAPSFSVAPSFGPSVSPSDVPSTSPSESPSDVPSATPSDAPSTSPSESPSDVPSATPSDAPSTSPSESPSDVPSATPSDAPSTSPSESPSDVPSSTPSSAAPT